jgi:hypothetical protein
VQQINGKAQGKLMEGSLAIPNPSTNANTGVSGTMINISQPSSSTKPNLQKPFY